MILSAFPLLLLFNKLNCHSTLTVQQHVFHDHKSWIRIIEDDGTVSGYDYTMMDASSVSLIFTSQSFTYYPDF